MEMRILYIIGNIRLAQNRLDDAYEEHQKCLQLRERNAGEIHPYTCASYHKLGIIHEMMGTHEKAMYVVYSPL